MKISVIMATLNAGHYLREALGSIAAQTFRPHEIIVVDGGSVDDTVVIAESFGAVRIIAQEGKGLPDAWNTGVRAAQGDALAFLDSDDVWSPEKLALQADCLRHDPSIDAVVGHVKFFLGEGQACPPSFKRELLAGTHPAPMPGALLIRRAAFDRVGWFDPRFRIASDIDWFARLRDLELSVVTLPHLVIHKRVHASNLSLVASSQSDYQGELVRLLFEKRRRRPTAGTLPPPSAPSRV